jgi:hypothetical protein
MMMSKNISMVKYTLLDIIIMLKEIVLGNIIDLTEKFIRLEFIKMEKKYPELNINYKLRMPTCCNTPCGRACSVFGCRL